MTPEQKAAYIIAQSACLMATIAGMQAENQNRQHEGLSPAYTQDNFEDQILRYRVHHNAVMEFFLS